MPAAFRDWTRQDLPDPAPGVYGGGTPRDVIWFKDGYVAVGTIATECCADSDPSKNVGVVWTSRDGMAWRLRDLGSTFQHASLGQLVTNGSVLLAIGSYAEPVPGAIAEGTRAMWVSNDGLTWQRASGPTPSIAAVRGSGFVGVETTGHLDTGRSRFMGSDDGLTWSYASAWFEAHVRGLAVDQTGQVLAIAYALGDVQDDGTHREDAVMFRSSDGATWTGPTIAMQSVFPTSVTAVPGGFYVTGWGTAPAPSPGNMDDAGAWRSTDGTTWEAVPLVVGDEEALHDVYAVGQVIVITGTTSIDGLGNEMVWVSTDGGSTWGRVSRRPAFRGINNDIAGLIETPQGLLAVGRRWDPESGHPLPQVWWSARWEA